MLGLGVPRPDTRAILKMHGFVLQALKGFGELTVPMVVVVAEQLRYSDPPYLLVFVGWAFSIRAMEDGWCVFF